MKRNSVNSFGEALAIGGLVLVFFIALFVGLFVFVTAITALVVALAWNWIGLHDLFGAPALTFWQVVGVAIVINLLRSVFSGGTKVTAKSE